MGHPAIKGCPRISLVEPAVQVRPEELERDDIRREGKDVEEGADKACAAIAEPDEVARVREGREEGHDLAPGREAGVPG